jgi:hypothetical protein
MRLAGLALAILVSGHPASAENPRKIAIAPGSEKGALLFEVPAWPAHQMIAFARNAAERRAAEEELIGIKPRPAGEGPSFEVMALPPGEYRLVAVYQQSKWAACLASRTIHVTIKPGAISYLGTLDTRPTLASIHRNAQANKHGYAETFQWHLYRTDVVAPRLTDRDPTGLARAERFVRENMPRSSAPVGLADLKWAPYQVIARSGRPNKCD